MMHVAEGADKMSSRMNVIIFLCLLALITAMTSVFFVDQRERVLLLRLGQIERSDFQPGIHFKIPFVNEVRRFDGRILSLDAMTSRYLTGEKKNVLVDSFILWRIADVSAYYTAQQWLTTLLLKPTKQRQNLVLKSLMCVLNVLIYHQR